MNIFEPLKRHILGGSEDEAGEETSESERQTLEQTIEQFDVDGVEHVFAHQYHQRRVNFVRDGCISRHKWRQFNGYVRSDDQRRSKWGIGEGHTEPRGQTLWCQNHDDDNILATYQNYTRKRLTASRRSRGESTQETTEGGANAQVANVKRSKTSEKNEQVTNERGTQTGMTKEILECETDDADCELNRRAFVKIGEFSMGGGQSQYHKTEAKFEEKAREVGVESPEKPEST